MSSGSVIDSSVCPRTNSPGCRMNGSSSPTSTSSVRPSIGCAHVDVGVARVVEHAELAVDADVDARGLDEARVVGIDDDPAGRDLGLDGAVAQDHGDGSLVRRPATDGRPKASPAPRPISAPEAMATSGGTAAEPPRQARRASERQDDRGRLLRRHDQPARGHEPAAATQELHLCPDCDADLVYPTHWSEVDRARWEVTLRCPNCEWSHTGVFDQDTVERFDEELDRGTDNLVDDLKRLIRANMEEEIDRFCRGARRATTSSPKTSRPRPKLPPNITLPPAAGPKGPAVPISGRRLRVAVGDAVGDRAQHAARAGRRPRPRRAAFASRHQLAGARARARRARPWRRSGRTPPRPARASRPSRRSSAASAGSLLAGEDQRQRHGAVEQVGAAVLAGALGRPAHVEQVVEHLERDAEVLRRTPRAPRPRAAGARPRQRAQPAGGREQARGLQPAAQHVALLVDVVAGRRRGAARARPRASARHASASTRTWSLVVVRGQQRERAREQRSRRWRSPSARPRVGEHGRRGRAAGRRGRPRRRGPASPCGPARRPPRRAPARRPRSPPAHRKTSSGRRRLPPAASVPAAASAQHLAVAGRDLLEQALGPFRSARASGPRRAAPTSSDGAHPRSAAGTAPEWIATMPPASTTYRTSRRPARVHQLRELVRGRKAPHRAGQVGVGLAVAGHGAEQRDDAVEPHREEPLQRRALRRRDLEDRDPARRGARRAPSRRSRAARSATLRTPKPTVAASKVASANGSSSALPWTHSTAAPAAADLRSASSSIGAEKSSPTTRPAGPTRRRSSSARSPVPQQTSSADVARADPRHVDRRGRASDGAARPT